MVRYGHRLLDAIHGVQFRYNCIFKASALIAVNAGQNLIDVEPFVDYSLDNGKCLLIVGNEGLTELGEGISQYQDVLFTVS